jgi:hypothetical protein
MTKLPILSALLVALAASACTITTSTSDIDPGPLSGMVDGQPWSFQAGNTDAFLSEGQDAFFATLYAAPFTPCTEDPSDPHLIVAIPKTPGDYQMDLSRNMTFVDGDQNLVAIDGRIVVDEVTSDHVSGGLHGTYDAFNDVSGQFDVTVCP